ncbi:MAG: hypothetical protein ACI9W6_000040 [Motiliproteus sp.]|jgi:hypothetical protein
MIWSGIRPLLVIIIGLLVCAQLQAAALDQADVRLRALAERWLTLMDSKTTDGLAYAPLLASAPLDLELLEGHASTLVELGQLLDSRFEDVDSSQHRIEYFSVKPLAPGLYQLSMVVDWRLLKEGLTEIASLKVGWRVRTAPDGSLRIEQLRERYLAPIQGMGARIKC